MLERRAFLWGCACCAAGALASPTFASRAFAQQSAELPPLAVTPLAENVWRHTSWTLLANGQPFPSNGIIVKGRHRVLIVDTTWRVDEMPLLLNRAAELGGGLPTRLAVTHAHEDRMSGIVAARGRGVRSTAYVLTQEDAPTRNLPLADDTWRGDRKTVRLGGRSVELFYPGSAHTRDNVVAFDSKSGVLFGGCQVRQGSDGALGNVADANVMAWPATTRRLIERYGARARIVVPGHGEPGGPALLEHTFQLAAAAAGDLMARPQLVP